MQFTALSTLALFLAPAMASPSGTAAAVSSAPATPSTSSACPYPNKAYVAKVYDNLATNNFAGYFGYVSPNVSWTVEGTQPLSGHYSSRASFLAGTIERLEKTFVPGAPMKTTIYNVVANECLEWSIVEFNIRGTCKNGLDFNNNYAWSTRWTTNGTIVEARAYLDSVLVKQAIVGNETPDHHYYDQRG